MTTSIPSPLEDLSSRGYDVSEAMDCSSVRPLDIFAIRMNKTLEGQGMMFFTGPTRFEAVKESNPKMSIFLDNNELILFRGPHSKEIIVYNQTDKDNFVFQQGIDDRYVEVYRYGGEVALFSYRGDCSSSLCNIVKVRTVRSIRELVEQMPPNREDLKKSGYDIELALRLSTSSPVYHLPHASYEINTEDRVRD
ncbi:MAG: hypothetical protein AABW73_01180 [Nanoarchaeota archaeon]